MGKRDVEIELIAQELQEHFSEGDVVAVVVHGNKYVLKITGFALAGIFFKETSGASIFGQWYIPYKKIETIGLAVKEVK